MQLSESLLSAVTGGQIVVTDGEETLRAGIMDAFLSSNGNLSIRYAWSAKLEDDRWVASREFGYSADLRLVSVRDDGPDGLFLSISLTGETARLYPMGHAENVDPFTIDDLEFAQV